jgi:D-alanyl-D-alanine carboxypeptidase
VLKKAGAQEPAPVFKTDLKVLESYTGNYRSDNVPLTFRVFVKDGNLFMQAAGQNELPLKARSATQFEFKAAGVEVEFTPDGSVTLKQGPGSYLFKKVPNQ